MELSELKMTIADLTGVEPRSIGSDTQAAEAAQWIDLQKKTEADANALLDPAIKTAFAAHKKLTREKKSLLEKLVAAKDRVRVNLANWIAGGHSVAGCYIKTSYRVTVTDAALVPDEYMMTVPDLAKIQEWVTLTSGEQPVAGCTIDRVNVLYAKESE